MKGEKGKIIAGFRRTPEAVAAESHAPPGVRRCKRCGIRKVLDRGFYRDRTSRGGYRQVCKKCRNRERARWARRRYVPKTGKRYSTKGDKAARGEAGGLNKDCLFKCGLPSRT